MEDNKMPAPPVEKTEKPVEPVIPMPKKMVRDVAKPVLKFRDSNVSNYMISPLGNGQIEARSSLTGEVFVGTIKEFNERVK